MKKYLYSALALPLLFACSSDDLIEKEMISNDQFAGIEKVNATFYMDEEGPVTRMDKTGWTLENGDLYGFAWLTDAHAVPEGEDAYEPIVNIDGKAYQNHNLIQTNGRFEPQTSIYVGKYYIYRPYDETTVSPQAINFNSLKEQPMAEGYSSTSDAWKALAKSAIIIGDKWTEILPQGRNYLKSDGSEDATVWDQPGIGKPYKVFAAVFSNQTLLELKYKNNNPTFKADKQITGATDIDYKILNGDAAGAADIYGATVQLAGAANSFKYAPTVEPNNGEYPQTVNGKKVYHDGDFWATKAKGDVAGFTFAEEVQPIVLKAPVDNDKKVIPIGTGEEGHLGQFWFNSLPVTTGDAATAATNVTTTIQTSYGTVTIDDKTLKDVAYAFEQPHEGAEGFENEAKEWIKLNNAEADDLSKGKDKKTWKLAGADGHKTFVNQFGNHKGKYYFEDVDFSTAVMDIHIVDDAHLQKYLKFYIASGKEDGGELILDGASATDKTFKLSKISIALLQTINKNAENKVLVKACEEHNAPEGGKVKIIVTQNGSAGKTEVPDLNNVFAAATDVYLAAGTDWTWKERTAPAANVVTVDANVASLTNEGNLTVNASNIQLSSAAPIKNAKDATMNITQVTTVKNALTNLGTINVPANKELRAYGVAITNDATSLTDYGTINNSGVVGVTYNTNGSVNNYGHINMLIPAAITLLTTNQTENASIDDEFGDENKLGTVVLPNGEPNALVSVSNGEETGFIEYTWTGDAAYSTPNNGVVKYNTLIVSGNIAFTAEETEIKYLKFDGVQKTVTNSAAANLPNLKGIIVNPGKSIIIEKNNILDCDEGSHLGSGATVYNGGTFEPGNTNIVDKTVTDYLGTWSTDQIVVWGQAQLP